MKWTQRIGTPDLRAKATHLARTSGSAFVLSFGHVLSFEWSPSQEVQSA